MKHLITSIFVVMILYNNLQAQTDTIIRYLNSDFETTADQQTWLSLPVDNSIKWIYATGGNGYEPPSAYSGTKNALFYWSAFDPFSRSLVSQPIDLSTAKKPELSFAHAMSESVFGQDNLILLFRAGSGGTWDTIEKFTQEVPAWTLRTFNIIDYGTKYLTDEFYVAFKGISNSGDGVCIDKVVIEEKDIIIRYPKSVKVNQINHSLIPRGVADMPLMRIDITIVGNTDPVILKSLAFNSLSSHDNIFEVNGFELVATRDSVYKPTSLSGGSLKIGSPASILDGTVAFSNINFNLPTGLSSIWLVADVKPTAPHASEVDFSMDAGSVVINTSSGTSTYPASVVSPPGVNVVEEAVVLDGFEAGNIGWTFTGSQNDFEIAVPQGKLAHTSRDPDCAYGGTKAFGTDLTVDGKYIPNISNSTAYYALSPVANLKYYANVKLYFMKWLAFEANDHAVIEVSTDTAKTWTRIWDSKTDALIPDTKWVEYTLTKEFNDLAARKPWVQVRLGIIYSDNSFSYAGWNLDNFAVTGNYLTNDVGITSLIKPVNDCLNPGFDSVIIRVKNYAPSPTTSSLPVFFSVDGITKIYDNIPGPIPVDGEVTFKFNQPANIITPGLYDKFTVDLDVPGDEDSVNDTIGRDLFIQKSLGVPDLENFETGGGYWIPGGSSPTWECITPEGGGFSPVPGSPKAWTLSPYGNYISNDTSYLISSCYDLAIADSLIFEMKLWLDAEEGKDGAVVEYSVDEGETWSLLRNNVHGWNWNWYNTLVASLGTPGWSSLTAGWRTVRQVLPAHLSFEPKVKFRVKWASDENNAYRGMAIDNVRIYEAPIDIGVSKIDSFANRCQGINPDEVTVAIKNMGINKMKQNDTIIVGFDFNLAHMETDTFRLAADLLPGQTVKHTFSVPVDVSSPGNYNLRAYTLIEDDPWFYQGNNDTSRIDFQVFPGPLTSLPDTIQTHIPDTVKLTTIYHDDYDYWWNGTSGSNTYSVQDAGWQLLTVTATRGNGCSSYDSTNVELLFYDLGAAEMLHPTDNCGFGKHEFPVVTVRNYGTDSIAAGQKIAVSYRMNSGPVVSDTIKLAATLYSGKAIDFTFTKGALDLSQKGTYVFDLKTTYAGDTVLSNDGVTRSAEILGRPAVNLGPNLIVQGLSHIINAGSGFESYLWDNNATLQTREINESGTYWVQVTDENLCDNSDTVNIWLKIRDVSPDGFASPLSDCLFKSDEPVSLRIVNSGTDTIPAGTGILVSYRFQAGTRVTGSFNLSGQLFPGAFVTNNFAELLDLGAPGDYLFEATAATTGDLRKYNDTTEVTVYRYARPVVDFGLESSVTIQDISYDIDAGDDPNYSYLWHDGFTEHLYTATQSGLCHVIATDTRTSCYDRDSVWVNLAYPDVGVTWTNMPVNGCTGEFDDVIVRVQSMGTSNIGSTTPISVACDVNGVRVVTESLVRSANLSPGASLELTLSGKVKITNSGSSEVRFYTVMPIDKKSENDTLVATFDALPAPVIDFGDVNGELSTDLPHVLDAGDGHKAYLWQDASTGQTFNVVLKGVYTVTVTGQNDCQATKTVRVNMANAIEGFSDRSNDVVIFPNPSNGLFQIRIETEKPGDLDVRIVDGLGKMVYMQQINSEELEREQIDIQHLPRGLYHIIIQHGTELHQGKIVIQ